MYLIKLDVDGTTVTFAERVAQVVGVPIMTPLDASYMLAPNAPTPGQTYDPVNLTFVGPPRQRWVTKLAFDNRFTMEESVKLKAMQVFPARGVDETDAEYVARTQIPAQLQVLAGRLSMASYVDLRRDDTRSGVFGLEAMGLLTAGRALEILDGSIEDHEYFAEA